MDEMETVWHLHEIDRHFDSEETKRQYLEIREKIRNSREEKGVRVPLTPQELDILTTPTCRMRSAKDNREYFQALREKHNTNEEVIAVR